MIKLSGYEIFEEIYTGNRTLIYRGKRTSDDTPVAIKVLQNPYPTLSELIQFRNQYTIAKNLHIPHAIETYSLENYGNGYALVMEDYGAISLKEEIKKWGDKGMGKTIEGWQEFLQIAIAIVAGLDGLYRHRIVHKDIKPANILIHPIAKEVKLIDFSLASLLPRETQFLTNPNVLEGTLSYLSPEQTGRMNRGIDYRTDFYSLGVTFYEILTGKLPFITNDPMELVYCHIAKQPPSASSTNPFIPPILSEIISKLMAKNAENRYQTALGLKYDLEVCLNQLVKTGKIEKFELAKRDISDRFVIPEKLYGRATEVAALLAAFERVAKGSTEMMLVTGKSGIGKTAVVNEIHKPILRQRGYFIKGKFEQFQRNIPFWAFLQAFRDLMGQLLGESDAQLQRWQEKIISALGDNARVIIEVIPELERIIGKQPPVPKLFGSAAQNRFNLVFEKFIQIFTTEEHPLTIFLDDLQWVDAASLKLLKLLMSEVDNPYLLLIGAYRDNEVSASHPLLLTLADIQTNHVQVNKITLAPLAEYDLNHLIADTLNCSGEIALPLSKLVYQKTQGNPFFATQFLKALYEDKLIYFHPPQLPSNLGESQGGWQCHISQIKSLTIADDVVEFMALQLQRLPIETQNVLKLAACIGNQFDLATLAIIYEKSQIETATVLWKALQEGLIIPITEVYKFFQDASKVRIECNQEFTNNQQLTVGYKFIHDRVQQAAYFLISPTDKEATHLKIGQLLLQNTPKEKQEEKIFEIINQLNIGLDLISDISQKNELAQLNLIAGKKAKLSTASEAAIRYFYVALELLPDNTWRSNYNFTLELYLETAEAEYLNINFKSAERLVETALCQVKNLLDQVKASELKIQIHIAQYQMVKAVEIGLQVLKWLQVSLSQLEGKDGLMLELPELSELDSIPPMTDSYKLAALRILNTISAPVFMAKPEIFPEIILTMVNLCLNGGNSALAAVGYGFYGLLLAGFGHIEAGYHAGKIALKILDRFDAKQLKAKVYNLFNANIRPWKEHAQNSVIYFQEGLATGLETGDIEWAAYCGANFCGYLFLTDNSLDSVVEKQVPYIEILSKIKLQTCIHFANIWRQLALHLQGKAADRFLLIGESFDEKQVLPLLIDSKSGTGLFVFYVAKTILYYEFQDYKGAIAQAILANEYAGSAFGFMQVALLNFYYSLALIADYPEANSEKQKQYLKTLNIQQQQMKKWADSAPMNYQHKYDLVKAETARILGCKLEAMDYYDLAIAGASANNYIQEEALAYQLAGVFYQSLGNKMIAHAYLTRSYYTYSRWGAIAKVQDLEQRYTELLTPILQRKKIHSPLHQTLSTDESIYPTISSSTSASDTLDFAALIKVSQALSSEIELEELLSTLMEVMTENAGAEKCVLILAVGDRLVVEGTAKVGGGETAIESTVLQGINLEKFTEIPHSIINYIKRTLETLVIEDAREKTNFVSDSYIIDREPRSILCTPILNQQKMMGILYLENNLTPGAFTRDRVEILHLLCSQAAISIENALLYRSLQESEAGEREKAIQLEQLLQQLQQAQIQLVQREKMAALGQLIAGVAHEINNPITFIAANLDYAHNYIQDLLNHLELYQAHYPNPEPSIQENAQAIEIDFLMEDLLSLIASMKVGSDRIRNISNSLRTFARSDSSQKVNCNIHEGIDSTLLILKYRLKANDKRPAIQVIKSYSDLYPINCFCGQLNQVFINIIANAIDAIDEASINRSFAELEANPYQIKISTELMEDNRAIAISIVDNGMGMSEEVKAQIFDYLFTTKAVGKGTGLGLSIARQIVEETHGGNLSCISAPGEGTKFIIQIPI
ncbi:MAG TPA: serine/threonine protein kinase [Cyanobacteria bacterium UBA11149]|nr:serine/threonine protein kinase [Cyanobacteria bacterium UBA11367]HBE57557.1 serine/threonine protein kinase [Cyanobacteria bacterium UBA11366]HBK62775.1 serine/threonine protein kinase [Cyanobacteria bacterium UBA11166]HBR73285.1 serine/threonine protein kinase [Cyanobacteria bacterium UBA11159]HBS67767.1 serine/threonine protein kinase [Cyanobacteria bacterium UBA11153]HBW92046.1 serine/threonine protein kinase [Cyanobacteria bacterium UBA11149]HCA97954.1 serine/threonine protein kinase 